jgi:hypothetical protein
LYADTSTRFIDGVEEGCEVRHDLVSKVIFVIVWANNEKARTSDSFLKVWSCNLDTKCSLDLLVMDICGLERKIQLSLSRKSRVKITLTRSSLKG